MTSRAFVRPRPTRASARRYPALAMGGFPLSRAKKDPDRLETTTMKQQGRGKKGSMKQQQQNHKEDETKTWSTKQQQ